MNIEEILHSKFDNEEVRAVVNLLYTSRVVYNKIAANVRKYGLYYEQFAVLRILKRNQSEPMSQKEILERMTDKSSNLTRIIARLKAKELISVIKSAKDRREYKITLTDKGRELINLIYEQERIDQVGGTGLTEKECTKLNQLLDKLRNVER